ncbi:MAG: biotin--[acetyl-CoA-carboxylase] ligase, partial [Chitinophagaceae bacterium]
MSSLNPIGTPFIELPVVDSTNNYAMGLVREAMAQHGLAVFAHEQTRGKGQRNRHWISSRGENIAISMVVQPNATLVNDLFLLSMMAATACKQFFNRYIADEICIKWPNDLYWRD